MQHYKSQTPQSEEVPVDAITSDVFPIDEVGYNSFLMDSPFLSGLTYHDHQITGHLASPNPGTHTLEQLTNSPECNTTNSQAILQSDYTFLEEQGTSGSVGDIYDQLWLQNNGLSTGYATTNPLSPSHLSNESFLDSQVSLLMPNEANERYPGSRNSWLRQSRPESTGLPSSNESRSLPRRKSRYSLQRTESIVVPNSIPNPSYALDPMQRWQESPPEDEPASMSAIMNSLKSLQPERTQCGGFNFGYPVPVQGNGPFSGFRRPASTASSHSSVPSVSSHLSTTSARSEASKRSHGSLTSLNKRSASRVCKVKGSRPSRRFCCTFCCDQFQTKYDWARHEKSLHLNLESWTCAPHGASVVSPVTGRKHCAYCNMLDPRIEHLEEHNYQACLSGSHNFRRKDHLVQHLRLTHHLDTMPLIDDWKTPAPEVTSRCGFCDRRLSSWEERIEHIASHFRNGSTMDDWRGEHDFPPEITKQVTKALPPYYIGHNSRCLIPFSATNTHAKDQLEQIASRMVRNTIAENISPNAVTQDSASVQTFDNNSLGSIFDVLAAHLGRYTRQKLQEGVIPTDEMLQQESRRLVYDSEDPWDQTIFDHPEWLAAYRRQHIEQRKNNSEDAKPALSKFDSLSLSKALHMGNIGT